MPKVVKVKKLPKLFYKLWNLVIELKLKNNNIKLFTKTLKFITKLLWHNKNLSNDFNFLCIYFFESKY